MDLYGGKILFIFSIHSIFHSKLEHHHEGQPHFGITITLHQIVLWHDLYGHEWKVMHKSLTF